MCGLRCNVAHARVAPLAARGAACSPLAPVGENARLHLGPPARPRLLKTAFARLSMLARWLHDLAGAHRLVHRRGALAPGGPIREEAVLGLHLAFRLGEIPRLDLRTLAWLPALVVRRLDGAMAEAEPRTTRARVPLAPVGELTVNGSASNAGRHVRALAPLRVVATADALTQGSLCHAVELLEGCRRSCSCISVGREGALDRRQRCHRQGRAASAARHHHAQRGPRARSEVQGRPGGA
mmetsp:Transcript_124604/g.265792  ORF Transcript_124604/g.265792 Transcript_124604/m.265792 type:complete len:239 (-) Transcript_124604:29-745(-)